LQDTCGVHNLHGIPGFLGGLFSAIAIAAYSSDPITNSTQSSLLPFYSSPYANRTFYQQGGIQVAGTVISLVLGIVFGFIAGQIIKLVYVFEAN
jgi:ammonia channel protein AmtB